MSGDGPRCKSLGPFFISVHLMNMKKCLAVLCSLFVLAGCGSQDEPEPASPPPNWRLVGQLSDGLKAKFVEIALDKAKDKDTYDSAVASLCKSEKICVVGFFLPGDKVPPSQSSKQFFGDGGWGQYSPTALWWSNSNSGMANYTKWDCVRAGVDGAPPDALCDKRKKR